MVSEFCVVFLFSIVLVGCPVFLRFPWFSLVIMGLFHGFGGLPRFSMNFRCLLFVFVIQSLRAFRRPMYAWMMWIVFMKGRMEDAFWMKTTHGCCGLFFGKKNEGHCGWEQSKDLSHVITDRFMHGHVVHTVNLLLFVQLFYLMVNDPFDIWKL